jgi:hypothetical protein
MPSKQHLVKRNVLFVLAATAVFMTTSHYHGPLSGIFHAYGGNFTASFAVYFVVAIALIGRDPRGLIAALAALLIVESFELADG